MDRGAEVVDLRPSVVRAEVVIDGVQPGRYSSNVVGVVANRSCQFRDGVEQGRCLVSQDMYLSVGVGLRVYILYVTLADVRAVI